MPYPAHTPEPWSYDNGFIVGSFSDRTVRNICDPRCAPAEHREEMDANTERILACVNACAGIQDPAAAIEAARGALRDALDFVAGATMADHKDQDARAAFGSVSAAIAALGGAK